MANTNKDKGDKFERLVLSVAQIAGFPRAVRTRAGYSRDAGDIHLVRTRSGPEVIVQCKDVVSPDWTKWLEQMDQQEDESGAKWSFIAWKRRRPGKSPLILAVMPLDSMLALFRAAGYGIDEETAQ